MQVAASVVCVFVTFAEGHTRSYTRTACCCWGRRSRGALSVLAGRGRKCQTAASPASRPVSLQNMWYEKIDPCGRPHRREKRFSIMLAPRAPERRNPPIPPLLQTSVVLSCAWNPAHVERFISFQQPWLFLVLHVKRRGWLDVQTYARRLTLFLKNASPKTRRRYFFYLLSLRSPPAGVCPCRVVVEDGLL